MIDDMIDNNSMTMTLFICGSAMHYHTDVIPYLKPHTIIQ